MHRHELLGPQHKNKISKPHIIPWFLVSAPPQVSSYKGKAGKEGLLLRVPVKVFEAKLETWLPGDQMILNFSCLGNSRALSIVPLRLAPVIRSWQWKVWFQMDILRAATLQQ